MSMPAGDGGSISVIGGENIVMFENSENKEAAMEFLRAHFPRTSPLHRRFIPEFA